MEMEDRKWGREGKEDIVLHLNWKSGYATALYGHLMLWRHDGTAECVVGD